MLATWAEAAGTSPAITAETQQRLRTVFANQRREALLARERDRLRRDSYLWLEPALAGEPPRAPSPGAGPSGP